MRLFHRKKSALKVFCLLCGVVFCGFAFIDPEVDEAALI